MEQVITIEESRKEIEDKINNLKEIKRELNLKMKRKQKEENRKLNKGQYSNGGNVLTRTSIQFKQKMDSVNKIRRGNNQDELSYPKQTELLVKHKRGIIIWEDIISYDIKLEGKRKC